MKRIFIAGDIENVPVLQSAADTHFSPISTLATSILVILFETGGLSKAKLISVSITTMQSYPITLT